MLSAGPLFLLSTFLFVLYALITGVEQRRGGRLFLRRLRDFADTAVEATYTYFRNKIRFLVRHTITLSWYYSIHSTLKALLTLLVRAYDALESLFVRNRDRTKALRAEKRALSKENHLTAMTEHKASTALTATQKKRLRAKRLEGK